MTDLFRHYAEQRLAADVEQRLRLVGRPYAKRREAALRGRVKNALPGAAKR